MSKLVRLNDVENRKLVDKLAQAEIIVYEDIQGHKIFVNYDGDDINIKSKSISSDIINMVDIASQKVYNKALNFFFNLPDRVKKLMKKDHWYCFEYFYDNQPANIEYDRLPKNNLILTSIVKNNGKKFVYDIYEIVEYANLFDCDSLPIIFKGTMNEDQINLINSFLNTSKSDLDFVFGEDNFAFFFYKILNPTFENSFLMTNRFQDNMEKVIIRFLDNNEEFSFEILNPMYTRVSNTNSSEHTEMYSIILLSFLEYSQLIDINDIKIKGENRDFLYLDLICKMYNKFVERLGDDVNDLDVSIPNFFKKDKFKINQSIITNRITLKHLKNDKLEYIFKIILSSFKKKRNKKIGIFNDITLEVFNQLVDDINKYLDTTMNILREKDINDDRLLNFADYFNVDYNTDGEGNVYPDIYSEIEAEEEKKKKKKK